MLITCISAKLSYSIMLRIMLCVQHAQVNNLLCSFGTQQSVIKKVNNPIYGSRYIKEGSWYH